MESGSPQAVWPLRIAACCTGLRAELAPRERAALRSELWVVLHGALLRYLRARTRGGFPPREEIEDIASAKAIELLARCESGVWAPEGRSLGEVASYVATVARNGFVDFTRRTRRAGWEAPVEEGVGEDGEFDAEVLRADGPPPHALVEARELARALVECAQRLQLRARRVWFFRAFYDMTSRDIAMHPGVGLDAADAPPGAFVELWTALESLAAEDPDAAGGGK